MKTHNNPKTPKVKTCNFSMIIQETNGWFSSKNPRVLLCKQNYMTCIIPQLYCVTSYDSDVKSMIFHVSCDLMLSMPLWASDLTRPFGDLSLTWQEDSVFRPQSDIENPEHRTWSRATPSCMIHTEVHSNQSRNN